MPGCRQHAGFGALSDCWTAPSSASLLGETAFAALNLAMPFVIINFSLADLDRRRLRRSRSPSALAGKHEQRGKQHFYLRLSDDRRRRRRSIGGILFAAAPLLIGLMGAEGDFAAMAVQYLRVYALCSPLTTIIFAVDNYLRICGYIRGSMLAEYLDVRALCAILEFLFLGVFRWGIWAAALATCSGMLHLRPSSPSSPFSAERRSCGSAARASAADMIRQIIACGSPNFLNNIAGRITSILMNAHPRAS